MCGIVCERIIKDVVRTSVTVKRGDTVERPSDTAFSQLEYVDISSIICFLDKANVLTSSAAKAALELGTLRNRYAHARGREPLKEARKALVLLHTLIQDTVSRFTIIVGPNYTGTEIPG